MVNACMRRQAGITFLGLVFVLVVMACVGVIAAEVTPTVVEYYVVQTAAEKSSQGTTTAEIRTTFSKILSLNNVSSLTADDLVVTKDGDKVVVRFAYQREIHLVGPAYLTLKYSGQSN